MKVRFINFERTRLPEVILKHNVEEKRKFFAHISLEDEKSEAEIQVGVLAVITFLAIISTMLANSKHLLSLEWLRLRVYTIPGFRIWHLLLTR